MNTGVFICSHKEIIKDSKRFFMNNIEVIAVIADDLRLE